MHLAQGGLAAIGALTALTTVWKLGSFLWPYVRPSTFGRYTKTTDGSIPWAFITGGSDGIGRAFAFELASRGFNIIIHGRNSAKLASVRLDLQTKYPNCECRIVIADASNARKVDFPDIASQVADVPLKVLVNNVGATMPWPRLFDTIENYTADELQDNIDANAAFPLLLTGALMPNLSRNQPALILNVGSLADLGMPLFPSYGPSKAFLMTSTIQLRLDMAYKKRDIEVLGLRIMQVTATGTIFLPKNFAVPDPATWVKSALARVGCGRPYLAPFFPHAIQLAILEGMPSFISDGAKIDTMAGMLEGDPTGRLAKEAAEKKGK